MALDGVTTAFAEVKIGLAIIAVSRLTGIERLRAAINAVVVLDDQSGAARPGYSFLLPGHRQQARDRRK